MRFLRRVGTACVLATLAAAAFVACGTSSNTGPGDSGPQATDGAASDATVVLDAAGGADVLAEGATVDAAVGMGAATDASAESAATDASAADASAEGAADAAADASAESAAASDAAADGNTDASLYDGPWCEGTCGATNCGTCPEGGTIGTSDSYQHKDFDLDAYEVTNASYAAFLAAHVDPATQPVFCAWNTSFVPSVGWPAPGEDTHPVEAVDWCDAYAYCAWAGRRLCGNIGGGTNATVYFDNGDQSQWFRGCTGGLSGTSSSGWLAYPYGNVYDAGACNGADYGANATIAVGAATGCQGGLAGLFDMSGNVSEWEDSCTDGDQSDAGPARGPTAQCGRRGGGFQDDAGGLACEGDILSPRTTAATGVGFRCCSR